LLLIEMVGVDDSRLQADSRHSRPVYSHAGRQHVSK